MYIIILRNGEFIFQSAGSSKEFTTEYEVDGDTLKLLTDGIVLTKVKS